jgi:hypothetical protein
LAKQVPSKSPKTAFYHDGSLGPVSLFIPLIFWSGILVVVPVGVFIINVLFITALSTEKM